MEENNTEKKAVSAESKTLRQSFFELLRFALLAVIIVVPIRIFLAEPFIVSGTSMVPTFQNADYLIVDKISYELGSPKRDDVIIFRYPKDTKKFFIKRVVGLPNETVDIKNGIVTIINSSHPKGFTLTEPFVKNFSSTDNHVQLGSDEYFVMGDNRSGSSDSRSWGPVKKNLLVGKALVRLLPIGKIGMWPGQYREAQ